jgi:hypothetical protein
MSVSRQENEQGSVFGCASLMDLPAETKPVFLFFHHPSARHPIAAACGIYRDARD